MVTKSTTLKIAPTYFHPSDGAAGGMGVYSILSGQEKRALVKGILEGNNIIVQGFRKLHRILISEGE